MSDEMKSHLINSIYGTPQTLPDERRQYLGSLRERSALRLTNQELSVPQTLNCLTKHIDYFKNQNLKFYINGKINPDITKPYIKLAVNNHFLFTLVADKNAQTEPSATGLLIAADQAINHDKITLKTLFQVTTNDKKDDDASVTDKPGFFKRLFH